MRTMPAWLAAICRIVIIVMLPLALTLTNVRLLMTHLFPEIEYSLPGFPADTYGFTKADRLKWSKISIDYLLNDSGIEFLKELRFPEGVSAPQESCQYYLDGDCNRFYNDRELKHMSDVKIVTRWALNIWVLSAILTVLSAGLLFYFREKSVLRAALLGGSGLTIVILVGIVTYLLLNFNTFFTQFHQVFFESSTWTFLWSDSLIRLFPLMFWESAFIFVGGGAILEALAVAAWAWWGLK
ncbi:MAG: TIGR01906 family membrane protein [Anaerolineales bacterium]